MLAGSLTIEMNANIARLAKDMGDAKRSVSGAMEDVSRSVGQAKAALASLGVGIGFGAIIAGFKGIVDAAASLDDLSEKTGASVEQLSKLSQVANIGGHSIEIAESALIRLSKALHGGDEEAKGAGKALAALGLQADALRGKDTAEALRIVAGELNKYADGSGKTALALDLLGKSGAAALPFLKDLATEQGIATRVTTGQAAAAEELQKNIRRLTNDMAAAKQVLALGLVPAISDWVAANREAFRIGGSTTEMLRLFVFNLEAMTTEKPGEQIRRLTAEMERLKGVMSGPWWKQSGMDFFGGEQSIKDKEKQIEFLKFLQRQEAAALGGKDTPGEMQRFGLSGAKLPLNYTGSADNKKSVEDILKLYEEVRRLGASMDVSVPRILDKDVLTGIKKTLEEGKKGWMAYAEAVMSGTESETSAAVAAESFTQTMEKLKQQYKDIIDPLREVKELHELLDLAVATGWATKEQAYLAKLDPQIRALIQPLDNIHQKIQAAWEGGFLTAEDMQKASAAALGETAKVTDEMTEFWRKAAHNMEDAMSNFFFDVMQGNLKGLASNFKRTIDQMVANILAAKAQTALFGPEFGKGGSLGGLAGGALSWLMGGGTSDAAAIAAGQAMSGGAMSGAMEGALLGGFASGGSFRVGGHGGTDSQLVAFRASPDERVTIETPGQRGRGMSNVFNFNISGNVDRATRSQIAAAAGEGVRRAMARNT